MTTRHTPTHCTSCDRPLVRGHRKPGPGQARHHGHGLCRACYVKHHYHATHPDAHDRAVDNTARLEDLQWMADTGECAAGAARRLGITRDALWNWCDDHGQRDLFARLAARDPMSQLTRHNQHTTRRTAA